MRRSSGRTRTSIANFSEIILTLLGTIFEMLLTGTAFWKLSSVRRKIVEYPMNPSAGRRVGIIGNECKALRTLRRVAPVQRNRYIGSVASVFLGDQFIFMESRAGIFLLIKRAIVLQPTDGTVRASLNINQRWVSSGWYRFRSRY